MAPGFKSILSRGANMSIKDSESKRKRVNRSAKLKQCKLEARREQWLSNQVEEEKQGEKSSHADTDPCVNDPGEVLHPEFTSTEALLPIDSRVSWASLLNSSVSTDRPKNPQKTHSTAGLLRTQAEPDPDLLSANSNSHTYLRIRRPESSPSPNTNECVFYDCGDMDASPKSCEDRSPKSKASKMGKGSRRSRGGRSNSKENECIVAEQKENKGKVRELDGTQVHTQLQEHPYCYILETQDGSKENECIVAERKENKGKEREFDGTQVHTQMQKHPYCYILETQDGWEVATDALGLHSKKSLSGVLQVKATPCNGQRPMMTRTTPFAKPAKQPGVQHSTHQRAWMQNNVCRPTSLPRLNKQRGLRVNACLNEPSDKPECPICTEDLDSTDTLFDSCPCGFNLCLFCYHKIASENGRCPGCRGVYMRDVSAKPAVLLPR